MEELRSAIHAALGGNEDGYITSADAIWPVLRLWTDRNADGRSRPAELIRPRAQGFISFETIPKFKPYTDQAGNYIPVYAWASHGTGEQHQLVDVFFKVLSLD